MNGWIVFDVLYSDRFLTHTIYLRNMQTEEITTITRGQPDLNRVKIGLVVNDPEDV